MNLWVDDNNWGMAYYSVSKTLNWLAYRGGIDNGIPIKGRNHIAFYLMTLDKVMRENSR